MRLRHFAIVGLTALLNIFFNIYFLKFLLLEEKTYRFSYKLKRMHKYLEGFFSTRLRIFIRMNQKRLSFIITLDVVVSTIGSYAQNTNKKNQFTIIFVFQMKYNGGLWL